MSAAWWLFICLLEANLSEYLWWCELILIHQSKSVFLTWNASIIWSRNSNYCKWSVWRRMISLLRRPGGAAGANGVSAAVDGNFRAASISWQAIKGNTVEIYLQTEWQRSYTGYTEANTGKFILGPTQAVIGMCTREYAHVQMPLYTFITIWVYLINLVTQNDHIYSNSNECI